MYRDYRIVAFTPSGRKRTQSILIKYLERNLDILDEYQVWLNTDKEQVEDTKWLKSLPKLYDWIKLVELPKSHQQLSPKQLNTGFFYPNTCDEKTIYIRFDDDIVFIDDNFFKNMIDFRIDNPEYFLVMGNIWNNATTSYIHQQLGHIPNDVYTIEEPYCMEETAWRNGEFAESIHNLLLDKIDEGTTSELFFGKSDLVGSTRFSISCFSFFGKDFTKFEGVIGQRLSGKVRWDEEIWLTEVYPIKNNKLNTICGSALVSHYSFFPQRPYLDKTDILDRYKQLAQRRQSGDYYKLLDESPKKVMEKLSIKKLPDFELPKATDTFTHEALAAEHAGFKPVIVSDNRVEIVKDGEVVGSISGEYSELAIDEMLVRAWRKASKIKV